MNNGFAIWRKPGEMPVGIRGDFQESAIENVCVKEGFFFKPWDSGISVFYLSGALVEDEAMLRTWTASIVSADKEKPAEMSRAGWDLYIEKIQQEILQGTVRKVVAARQTVVSTRVSLYEAFMEACLRYPKAFVSLVSHPRFGTWLGATPEILIQPSVGGTWETVSMAGTLLDEQVGWTEKEKEENAATQEFMEGVLADSGANIIDSGQAEVVRAGALLHLVRRYRFDLSANSIQLLIARLHPTPAVGGLPRDKALSLIQKFEIQSRGLFTGFIGFYQQGKPHLWVNLRCCEWLGNRAILHAGAGINALSDAVSEWDETAAKMQTIAVCL